MKKKNFLYGAFLFILVLFIGCKDELVDNPPIPAPTKYTVSAIAENGKISPSTAQYVKGSNASVSLIPDFGFKNPSIISVNGNDVPLTSDSYNVSKSIADDYKIKATFEKSLSWYFVQTKWKVDSLLIKDLDGSWSRYKLWGVKGETQQIYSFSPDGSYTIYDDVAKKIIGDGPGYLWSIDETKTPAILNMAGESTELEEVNLIQIRSAKYDVQNADPKVKEKGSIKVIFTPLN
ncbi:MAG: hypothetical protein WC254_06370 [Candidatus Woesearchaeota archaeon]|jgi:hypothetical protein